MAQAGPSPPRNFITESRIGPPALRSWPGDRVALVNVEPWLVTPGPPARAGRSHGPPASPSVTVTVTSPYGHCQRPWYGRVTGPSATEPLMIADVTLCNARAALAAISNLKVGSAYFAYFWHGPQILQILHIFLHIFHNRSTLHTCHISLHI